MTHDQEAESTGVYMGATAEELSHTTPGEMANAGVAQHAQFKRHGAIVLTPEHLLLTGWYGTDQGDSVALRREDILQVETRFTDLYGRFEGGILNVGKPLILTTRTLGEIYLLIDWKEFMEITHDRQWERKIKDWLARGD